MKKSCLRVSLIAVSGALICGCTGSVSTDCIPNAKTICAEGAIYWVNSCGKQGEKVGGCGCGCSSDFSACKEPCDCTPNCGSRTCGLDPLCGTVNCGNCSGATPICNPATGTCAAALECPTITGSRDAIIKQRDPNLNFGHVDYVEIGVLSKIPYRSLSQFDIDTPAGTKVQSASLDLFWDYSRPSRPTATELEIYRVDKPWQEDSVSWNKRDVNDTWDNAGGDWRDKNNVAQGAAPYAATILPVGDAANDYVSVDITQLVQEWSDGTHPNYGLLLKTSNAGERIDDNHVAFVGLEDATGNNLPRLVINTPTCANEQVATPVFSPPGGAYPSAQDVAISTSTAGASVYYTLDASPPKESSNLYSGSINVSSTTTIKTRAFKSGMAPSAVTTATYTIGKPTTPQRMLYINEYEITKPPGYSGAFVSPAAVDTWINDAAFANVTDVVVFTRSEYLEATRDPTNKGGWDSRAVSNWQGTGMPWLEYVIQQAHAKRIKVHLWWPPAMIYDTRTAEYRLFGPSAGFPYNQVSKSGTVIPYSGSPARLDISFPEYRKYSVGLWSWVAQHYRGLDGIHFEEPIYDGYSYSKPIVDKVISQFGYDPSKAADTDQVKRDMVWAETQAWNEYWSMISAAIVSNRANPNLEFSANCFCGNEGLSYPYALDLKYLKDNKILDWFAYQNGWGVTDAGVTWYRSKQDGIVSQASPMPVVGIAYAKAYNYSKEGYPIEINLKLLEEHDNTVAWGAAGAGIFTWHTIGGWDSYKTIGGTNVLDWLHDNPP